MQIRNRNSNQRKRPGARPTQPVGVLHPAPPKENSRAVQDLREHRRYRVAGTSLRVIWVDAKGNPRMELGARPIDVSEMGIAVLLPAPARLTSRIRLESDEGELFGHGKVRDCRPMGAKYVVGIEFADSLRWVAPEGPITEPIPLCAPIEEKLAPEREPDKLASAAPEPSQPYRSAFVPKAPEPHLSLDSGAEETWSARLPMMLKAGAPLLIALSLGVFFLQHGGRTSTSIAVHAASTAADEQGWVTEWASDAGGSRRGRQLTLYRPSAQLSDYQMQFTGQIESKAIGWVFRAADTNNYYGMKIENGPDGSVLYTRFAVVNGLEKSVTQKRLPIQARVDTAYNVKLEAIGPRFSVYVQGEPVELWTDSRLKTGALGFMNESLEKGRTSDIRFSF